MSVQRNPCLPDDNSHRMHVVGFLDVPDKAALTFILENFYLKYSWQLTLLLGEALD